MRARPRHVVTGVDDAIGFILNGGGIVVQKRDNFVCQLLALVTRLRRIVFDDAALYKDSIRIKPACDVGGGTEAVVIDNLREIDDGVAAGIDMDRDVLVVFGIFAAACVT